MAIIISQNDKDLTSKVTQRKINSKIKKNKREQIKIQVAFKICSSSKAVFIALRYSFKRNAKWLRLLDIFKRSILKTAIMEEKIWFDCETILRAEDLAKAALDLRDL
ncbi:MAG: hypothetical protein KAH84_09230 [Thiomargarita sp.]|nr:hypothetical protein [Thiomargarita sp.]